MPSPPPSVLADKENGYNVDISNFGNCKNGAPPPDDWSIDFHVPAASIKSYILKCENNHINGYTYSSANCKGTMTKHTDVYEFTTGISTFIEGLTKKTMCFWLRAKTILKIKHKINRLY